jgi:hypothetical protein
MNFTENYNANVSIAIFTVNYVVFQAIGHTDKNEGI